VEGAIPLASMTRVAALLRDDSGTVEVALRFRLPASGAPRLEGVAHFIANLTCQRCLGPLDLEMGTEVKVSFTGGDEALGRAELAAGYEPLETTGRIGLVTIIEDELLVSLPDFPMHLPETCAPAQDFGSDASRDSPFGNLRARLGQIRT